MRPYQVQDGSAHAAAAPPNGAMNSRGYMRSADQRARVAMADIEPERLGRLEVDN
jgi:hypothetical protein